MSILSGFRKQKKYIKDSNGDFKLASNWTSTDTVELSDNVVSNETTLSNATEWDNTYDSAITQPSGLSDLITKTTTAFKNIKFLKNRTDSINIQYFEDINYDLDDYRENGKYHFSVQMDYTALNLPLGRIPGQGQSGTLEVVRMEIRGGIIIHQFFRYDANDESLHNVVFSRQGVVSPATSHVGWGVWRSDSYFTAGESYSLPRTMHGSGYIDTFNHPRNGLIMTIPLPKTMKYVNIQSNPTTMILDVWQNGNPITNSRGSGYFSWAGYVKQDNYLYVLLADPDGDVITGENLAPVLINVPPYGAESIITFKSLF